MLNGLGLARQLLETRALDGDSDVASALRGLAVAEKILEAMPLHPDVAAALRGITLARQLLATQPLNAEATAAALDAALRGLALGQELLQTQPVYPAGQDADALRADALRADALRGVGLRGLALARQLLETQQVATPPDEEVGPSSPRGVVAPRNKNPASLTTSGAFDDAEEAALIAYVRHALASDPHVGERLAAVPSPKG